MFLVEIEFVSDIQKSFSIMTCLSFVFNIVIDLTCLLILIEQFLSVHIVWLVFIFMIMKEFFRFLINMFFVIMSGWCESKVEPNP